MKKIKLSPKYETTVRINGIDALVELTSWMYPEQVTLGHLTIGDHPLRVTSLNVSTEELFQCLRAMVVLQEDQSALTQHQLDFKRASQELRDLWERQSF